MLLDDVASSVRPHPKPDALFGPTVKPGPNHIRIFRPRLVGIAAASLMLFGGSALAVKGLGEERGPSVTPADVPVDKPGDRATTNVHRSHDFDGDRGGDGRRAGVEYRGSGAGREPRTNRAHAPEPTVPATEPTVPVTVPATEPTVPATQPTVPATRPTTPPAVVAFTANLGGGNLAGSPMKQGFYGTAQPGSAIRVASEYGVAETKANNEGKWEASLKMIEVPGGTTVGVRITANTSDRVFEFALLRPVVPPPVVVEFTANLGGDGTANSPMTQGFYGTAQPGSAIRIGSEFGVAETVAGENGKWEAKLIMNEIPPGTKVGVRITSSKSDRVFEFALLRPGAPAPAAIDFTANAGWTTTDATPPAGEYWGNSTAGAVISITSPYGNKQVESNGEGHWTARLEFPEAPIGATFTVHITSSKGSAVYDFSLTRVAAG